MKCMTNLKPTRGHNVQRNLHKQYQMLYTCDVMILLLIQGEGLLTTFKIDCCNLKHIIQNIQRSFLQNQNRNIRLGIGCWMFHKCKHCGATYEHMPTECVPLSLTMTTTILGAWRWAEMDVGRYDR